MKTKKAVKKPAPVKAPTATEARTAKKLAKQRKVVAAADAAKQNLAILTNANNTSAELAEARRRRGRRHAAGTPDGSSRPGGGVDGSDGRRPGTGGRGAPGGARLRGGYRAAARGPTGSERRRGVADGAPGDTWATGQSGLGHMLTASVTT